MNTRGSSKRARRRHSVQGNLSETSDGVCTIFRDHGFWPWNAASQEQSKQRESQAYEPIHTAFMEPAMTNHLRIWSMCCFLLMKLVRNAQNRFLALASMKSCDQTCDTRTYIHAHTHTLDLCCRKVTQITPSKYVYTYTYTHTRIHTFMHARTYTYARPML